MPVNVNITELDKSPELFSSLIVGVVYIMFPLFLLFVYVVFNMLLRINDEFRKLTASRLMFSIGIFDCLQLICHIFSGIVTIWPSINTRLPQLNQIFGTTAESAWMTLFPLSLITSVYRLLIIRKIADPESKLPLLIKIGISLSFVYFIAFWACFFNFAQLLYDPYSWSWSFTDQEGSNILSQIDVITCLPLIALTFIVYVAIAVTVYRMNHEARTTRKTEMQLITQAGTIFLVLTGVVTFWHYHDYLFPDSLWTMFFINMLWILACGLNPLLYLMCSRRIRRSFLQFIHASRSEHSNTVVSMIALKSKL